MALFTGRKLSIALYVSLVVNVLLVSAIAANVYRERVEMPHQRGGFGMERLAERLPAADGVLLRNAYRARADELAASLEELRGLRQNTRRLLRSPSFDRQALADAMAAQRARQDALVTMLHDVLFEAASQMSPEGRGRLAEWPRRR
jgi:uncharacterized membrane protein